MKNTEVSPKATKFPDLRDEINQGLRKYESPYKRIAKNLNCSVTWVRYTMVDKKYNDLRIVEASAKELKRLRDEEQATLKRIEDLHKQITIGY
jgi:hypothetical protein